MIALILCLCSLIFGAAGALAWERRRERNRKELRTASEIAESYGVNVKRGETAKQLRARTERYIEHVHASRCTLATLHEAVFNVSGVARVELREVYATDDSGAEIDVDIWPERTLPYGGPWCARSLCTLIEDCRDTAEMYTCGAVGVGEVKLRGLGNIRVDDDVEEV